VEFENVFLDAVAHGFVFLCPLPNRKFNTLLLMPNLEWIIFTEMKYVPSEIFSDIALNLLQHLEKEVSKQN